MKQKVIFLLACLLSFAACNDNEENSATMEEQQKQERIIQMKAWEEQMTMDIEAMKAIVVPGDYITSVSHNAEGTADTVKFKKQKPVVIRRMEKVDVETPLIGLQQGTGSDTGLYWTLNGTVLSDADGNPLQVSLIATSEGVSGTIPQVTVGENLRRQGYFTHDAYYLSVDNGSTWKKIMDKKETGRVSAFDLETPVTPSGDVYVFKLADGVEVSSSAKAPLKVSILGGAYCTFKGYLPAGNTAWYPDTKEKNDVQAVEDTCWWKLINDYGLALERNESWSGGTVSSKGWDSGNKLNAEGISYRSYLVRMKNLGENPDIIFIEGGLEDYWAVSKAPLGEVTYADWSPETRVNFLPAFCEVLDYVTKNYATAKIYHITADGLPEEYVSGIEAACEHYDVPNIVLENIEYVDEAGYRQRPTKKGMADAYTQIKDFIEQNGGF